MAIMRVGAKKEPFTLQDVLPNAGGASLDTLRRHAKRLIDENCLVRLPGGVYIAASAQHTLPKAKPVTQDDLISFLASPRNLSDVSGQFGLGPKPSRALLKPLLEAGTIHRMRLGSTFFYATKQSALDEAASARETARTPRGDHWSPRFGCVSNIGASLLRQKAATTSANNQPQRTAA